MERQCGANHIINYNKVLGSGTHGIVYESLINSNIAVKVYPFQYCKTIKEGEFAIQEMANQQLQQFNYLVKIPEVYGFKYLPNSVNPKCCMYYMDKLKPINNYIIQLSFNYDRNYSQVLPSGYYVGIDTLKGLGYNISMINKSIASMMALFHYGLKIDAFDVEFVLTQDGIYAIDYDKVNYYNEDYEYSIKRKLTESDYDQLNIRGEKDVVRLLATSIMYCPHIDYPEYQEWKETYIHTASKLNKQILAQNVMKRYEMYF